MKSDRSRSRSRDRGKKNKENGKATNKYEFSDSEEDPFGVEADMRKKREERDKIMRAFKTQEDKKEEEDSEGEEEKQQPVVPSKERDVFTSVEIQEKSKQAKKTEEEEEDYDMFDDAVLGEQQLFTNPTDAEGYYRVVSGEILNEKYKIIEKCGKGVFGSVVKAVDMNTNKQYAIKIIRCNEILTRSGEKQYRILSKINNQYVVKCYEYFFHRKHLCLVFELLLMDLRVASQLRNTKPLDLDSIKIFAIHLFIGLHGLRKAKLVHADIKPDNIMLTLDKKTAKFCDFGTAFPIQQASIVQYLVARYYRAPQILLGCNLDYAIDVWSVGCTLFEMFTGQFLFPGKDNNEMLKCIMQTKGKFSIKMLKKGVFTNKHFDNNYNFLEKQVDTKTWTTSVKAIAITVSPHRELLYLLKQKCPAGVQHKKLTTFRDFLQQCLALNPKHRLTPEKALQHPFLNYQITLQ